MPWKRAASSTAVSRRVNDDLGSSPVAMRRRTSAIAASTSSSACQSCSSAFTRSRARCALCWHAGPWYWAGRPRGEDGGSGSPQPWQVEACMSVISVGSCRGLESLEALQHGSQDVERRSRRFRDFVAEGCVDSEQALSRQVRTEVAGPDGSVPVLGAPPFDDHRGDRLRTCSGPASRAEACSRTKPASWSSVEARASRSRWS